MIPWDRMIVDAEIVNGRSLQRRLTWSRGSFSEDNFRDFSPSDPLSASKYVFYFLKTLEGVWNGLNAPQVGV